MTDTVAPVSVGGPLRPGPIVGRTSELAALEDLLAQGDVRLVTLTGPAGVGKSRLAAEAWHDRASAGDVAVHVPLGTVADSGLAVDALVAALRDSPEDASTPAQALWHRADGVPVLLVLDDGDEVEGLPELVLDLLDSYPALTVLATRVRSLRVRGERVLALKPFPVASGAQDGPAVEMFAGRAAAADASFVLDDDNRAAVAEVCRAVGGLPLAIELAAARVASVPPASMARQLERSLDVLHQGEAHGVPDRHRSVDAALEWSIHLLTPDAASVLAQLSVFEATFPLEAAQQVLSPYRAEPELLDLMSELVDSHLLALDSSDPDEVAFALAPLVRGQARRRLVESGDEGRARDAHAEYWSVRCRRDPAVASRCWPDVLAALDRRVATGQLDEALQVAVAAAPDLVSSPGAQASLLPLVETVIGDGSVSDDALVARTLMWATVHAPTDQANLATYGAWTSRRIRQSIELARSSGDDAALLEALELTVSTLGVTFDLEGAVACAYEGHALAARRGDERAQARFDVWVAMSQGLVGDRAAMAKSARSAYERGLRVGEDTAVVHSALMLHGQPPTEQGPVPLLGLEDLLSRAEALRQPPLVLHVLAATLVRDAAMGDQEAAVRTLGRMLLVADGVERTWPMASVAPLMLMVPIALQRGAVQDAIRVRESMADIEHLLPSIVPSLAPAYLAAIAPLRDLVAPDEYDALAAETRGLSLTQANRRAQQMVRGYLPARPRTAPKAPADPDVPGVHLTPRELDVLRALVAGGTNREIAEAVGMAPKTVMHHTVAIYRKLGVRGRAEAVAWALRSGTIPSD